MRAKKSLGQHFLTSQKAINQIVDAGDIHADDLVLEIGPGQGVLTQKLVLIANKVIAIEKDRELIPLLEERFADAIQKERLEVIERDILEFNPEILKFYNTPYKLIANIPYYITGAIIEQFLSTSYQPERMVLLMQKEVAERIIARDGKESILSIAIKAYGIPKIIDKVPAGAFNPPPKVDSAILLVSNISRDFFADCDETLFFAVMKSLFGKKRKQIGGSLAEFLSGKDHAQSVLQMINIDPRTRPEDLTLANWKQLAQTIHKEEFKK